MEGFGPTTFGELNADDYDALHDPGTTAATVQVISELAAEGTVLELAIGTGRVALPLAQRGLDVTGIEASPDMVAKLRAKPGGDALPVLIGDFADVAVDRSFDHVFLVYNTLFNLRSQSEQVRCFANVADRLNANGTFLIEAFVPDFAGYTNRQRVSTKRLDKETIALEAVVHDPVRQVLEYQRVRITQAGVRLVPLPLRYAWPAEIDLMARLAGLTLVHRWGGWDKSPFGPDSRMHISVYRKPI